jgi:hypothetical protein
VDGLSLGKIMQRYGLLANSLWAAKINIELNIVRRELAETAIVSGLP